MNIQAKRFILYGTLIIVGLYFFFHVIIKGQSFFVPLTIAILLAMLVVPVAKKLESWGISTGWSAFFSDLLLIGVMVLFLWVIGIQVQKIQSDWPQLKQQLLKTAEKVDKSLDQYSWAAGSKLNLKDKLEQVTSNGGQQQSDGLQQQTTGGNASSQQQQNSASQQNMQQGQQQSMPVFQKIWVAVKGIFGFVGTTLLVFIYVFFFLTYRRKFSKSLLHFVPDNRKERTKRIIKDSSGIAQKYLLGKLILIILLAILYSIGLSISGIKYAILISILAAVLSLIPYIGNIIGAGLAIIMALLAGGGGMTPLIGVIITFGIAQFVESYILEPFVVGDKVNLNPVMIIIAVVFGEFVWGVPGMIIAIPVLGILKVIWDHIPAFEPLGYTVGDEDIDEGDNKFKKIEKWIKNKFSKK